MNTCFDCGETKNTKEYNFGRVTEDYKHEMFIADLCYSCVNLRGEIDDSQKEKKE